MSRKAVISANMRDAGASWSKYRRDGQAVGTIVTIHGLVHDENIGAVRGRSVHINMTLDVARRLARILNEIPDDGVAP